MIPKVIHYCWFGKNPKPMMVRQCISSWRKYLPDFEIREWNEDTFNMNECEWIINAYREKKWAFVADYVRFSVLYTWGGIYLDTDVLLKKPFDLFLHNSFFSALEFPLDYKFLKEWKVADDKGNFLYDKSKPHHLCMCGILAAIMGAESHHPLVKDCLDYYIHTEWKSVSTSMSNQSIVCDDIILSKLWNYGYLLKDNTQKLTNGITIYDSSYFGGSLKYQGNDNYAVHMCSSTWREEKGFKVKLKHLYKTIMSVFLKFK